MRRALFRRPRAREDLIEIWSYIADDKGNEAAADRVLGKIENVLMMLADYPEAGRARPEFDPGLRSFASGNYVIFYCSLPDGIDVVRVVSGYRDVQPEDMD